MLPGGKYLQRIERLQSHSAFENSFSDKLGGSSAFDPKFISQQGNISDRSALLASSPTAATWVMAEWQEEQVPWHRTAELL